MTAVLIKRGRLDTDTHTRSTPGEDKGRDWEATPTGQRTHANHPKQGKAWNSSLPQSPQKELTLPTPRFQLLSTRTERQ